MHMQWMAGRYCKNLSPPRRRQFELKVLCEEIFKGAFLHSKHRVYLIESTHFSFELSPDNKKSYRESITKWFVDNRLSSEQQGLFRSNFEPSIKSQGETILVINILVFVQGD